MNPRGLGRLRKEELERLFREGTLHGLRALADRKRVVATGEQAFYQFSTVSHAPSWRVLPLDESLPQRVRRLLEEEPTIGSVTLGSPHANHSDAEAVTGVQWLRGLAWLRVALPLHVRTLARWDALGPHVTQLSLDHGVSEIAGPRASELPLGAPSRDALSEPEVRALIVRARRIPVRRDETSEADLGSDRPPAPGGNAA